MCKTGRAQCNPFLPLTTHHSLLDLELGVDDVVLTLAAVADRLGNGLNALFACHRVAGTLQWLGARFGIYFGITGLVASYRDAVRHQRERMLRFIALAVKHGVYFHDYGGAACHHGFCAAMTDADAEESLRRLDAAVKETTGR